MSPTKLTPAEVDWRTIVFKSCEVHTMLNYAGDRCPVCVAIEDRELALGRMEEEKTQLEGRVADLEQQVDGYRSELRL